MELLTDIVGGLVGSVIGFGLATAVLKMWFKSKLDKDLEEFRSTVEQLKTVSTTMYRNREKAIFDFNIAIRGLVGQWASLATQPPATKSEMGYRWTEIKKFHEELQLVNFKARLVFNEPILGIETEIFEKLMTMHEYAFVISHYHAVRLDYRFAEDLEESPPNVSEGHFRVVVDKLLEDVLVVNKQLIPRWESAARESLISM